MSDLIIVQQSNNVTEITINRESALNALNRQVLIELNSAVIENKNQVITITGAGSKAFVAGADISAMKSMSSTEAYEFSRCGHTLLESIGNSPAVVIAAVNGFALGGGCELAMACDIILCAEEAKFGQPETGLGLIAGFGGTQNLVERVGLPLANDLLLAGRNLSGIEAVKYGLAADCTPLSELPSLVSKRIKRILRSAPEATAATKRLVRKARELPLADGLQYEAESFANCFATQESKEGISAFLEKRSPNFQ